MLDPAALPKNKQSHSIQEEYDWEKLWDELYSKDFLKFLWLTWIHLDHEAVPTPIQCDIANHLQYGPQRTCVEAFRGLGKSYITCAYAAWRLRHNPNEAILIVSASKDKATDNANFIRDLIYTMPILEPLRLTTRDRQKKRKPRDSALKFDVHGCDYKIVASVTCAGIEGNVTGKRATIIILDDIEDPLNAISITQRQKIQYLASEFEAIIKPGVATRIIYLGTPHSSASIYTELPGQGYEVKMWPAVIPSADWMNAYGQFLGDYIRQLMDEGLSEGTSTDPRFPEDELARRRISMKGRYASQFLLDPRANDAQTHPFRMEDLIVMDCDPDTAPVALTWSSDQRYKLDLDPTSMSGDFCYTYMYADPRQESYENKIMAIDPSGKGKDQTGVCIMGKLFAKLHCLELKGFDGGFDEETLKSIARMAYEYRVTTIYSEKNYGGGMFDELLKPYLAEYLHHGWSCRIEQKHNTIQKELRICDTCEPVWSGHRIVMNKKIIQRDARIRLTQPYHAVSYQFTQMTRERGSVAVDDLADVFSMAVAFFTEQLGVSEEESLNKHNKKKEEERWKEIYKLVETNKKSKKRSNSFMHNKISMNNKTGMFN